MFKHLKIMFWMSIENVIKSLATAYCETRIRFNISLIMSGLDGD